MPKENKIFPPPSRILININKIMNMKMEIGGIAYENKDGKVEEVKEIISFYTVPNMDSKIWIDVGGKKVMVEKKEFYKCANVFGY